MTGSTPPVSPTGSVMEAATGRPGQPTGSAVSDDVKSALQLAYGAESDLLEEYKLLRLTGERSPQLSAMAAGVKALRACIALLEKAEGASL